MIHKGRMGSFSPPSRAGRDPGHVLNAFAQALNDRRLDDAGLLVADDLVMLDSMSDPIHGRRDFVAALARLYEKVPDLRVVFADITPRPQGALVRGRIESAQPAYAQPSLWHFAFADGVISQIQSFRADNTLSLVRIARQAGVPV